MSPTVAAPPPANLRWLKADVYHIRTACGRYTVSKMVLGGGVLYIAWKRNGAGQMPTELGVTSVSAAAQEAATIAAIRAMQKKCLEDAGAT